MSRYARKAIAPYAGSLSSTEPWNTGLVKSQSPFSFTTTVPDGASYDEINRPRKDCPIWGYWTSHCFVLATGKFISSTRARPRMTSTSALQPMAHAGDTTFSGCSTLGKILGPNPRSNWGECSVHLTFQARRLSLESLQSCTHPSLELRTGSETCKRHTMQQRYHICKLGCQHSCHSMVGAKSQLDALNSSRAPLSHASPIS